MAVVLTRGRVTSGWIRSAVAGVGRLLFHCHHKAVGTRCHLMSCVRVGVFVCVAALRT